MTSKEMIPLSEIESELARLWDSEKSENRMRACLFTLIIYAQEERRANYFNTIINSIIQKFPCRIILIQENKDSSKSYLKARASNKLIGQKETLFACDQIVFEATSCQMHWIPLAVAPHIIPDLPVYLLWGQDLTIENAILPALLNYATRLIFDSESAHDLQQFSRKMMSLIDSVNIDIMDLNWVLGWEWRSILAKVFNTQEKLDQLKNITQIQLTYNARVSDLIAHSEIQPIYLQGWLAAQMNWKFLSLQKHKNLDNVRQIIYTNGRNDVVVSLIPQETEALLPGAILSVELLSSKNYFFLIAREAKQPKVTINISTLERCELPITLRLQDLHVGVDFINAIFYTNTQKHYRNMLQSVSEIDGKLFQKGKP